jgi:hypothetical protein
MSKLRIQITAVDDDGKEFHQQMEFTHQVLQQTPNPRQALVAHTMFMIREVLSNVSPAIKNL